MAAAAAAAAMGRRLRHLHHRYAIHLRRHRLLHHPKDGSLIHRPGYSTAPEASNDLVAAGSGSQGAEQAARACTSAPVPDDTSRAASALDDSSLPAALVQAGSAQWVLAAPDDSSCNPAVSAQ